MIKRRTQKNIAGTGARVRVPIRETETESDSLSDASVDKTSEKIQAVRELHRLKRRCRGLPINVDILEKKPADAEPSPSEPVDDSAVPTSASYRLLDKSFQAQATRSERVMDEHLEKFLEERLKQSDAPSSRTVDATVPQSQKAEEELQKALFELPEHLKVPDSAVYEKDKMTWVTGLMEVPLTLDAKLRSIEEVETAKRRELAASQSARYSPLDELSHQTSVLGHRFRKPFPRKHI